VSAVAGVPPGFIIASAVGIGHPDLLVVLLAGSSAAVAFPIIEERGLTGPVISATGDGGAGWTSSARLSRLD
jgi:hypothetical protein